MQRVWNLAKLKFIKNIQTVVHVSRRIKFVEYCQKKNDLVKKIAVENAMKRIADLKARKTVLGRITNVFFSLY